MAKMQEIKAQVQAITGLVAFDENEGVSVLVTGDKPAMVSTVAEALKAAGVSFVQSKHRKFKGALFSVPLRNVGTAWNADWEFAA